jgi:aldose 1-epimerase
MRQVQLIFLGVVLLVTAVSVNAATAKRVPAGALQDGTPIEAVELQASNGVSARILTYGAPVAQAVAQ